MSGLSLRYFFADSIPLESITCSENSLSIFNQVSSSESASILSTVDREMTLSTIGILSSLVVISLTLLIISGL